MVLAKGDEPPGHPAATEVGVTAAAEPTPPVPEVDWAAASPEPADPAVPEPPAPAVAWLLAPLAAGPEPVPPLWEEPLPEEEPPPPPPPVAREKTF